MTPGSPHRLGATPSDNGVDFALVAPSATKVELCLFDTDGRHEQQRIALPGCTDGVWHGRLPGARPGLVYGYRVHGPWAPRDGQRFNPAKVLLDPYAREVVGHYGGEDIFRGHDASDPARPDRRDNAVVALKARVAAPLPPVPPGHARIAAGDRVIYEAHVRNLTRRHPGVPEALRGSFAGLAQPVVLDHLQRLGVTTLSLMPVQHRADEARLLGLGLTNHWGYNTIGWFAPEARYGSGQAGSTPAGEFRAMADALHARGMELLIDVVYNHSAETDEHGPTISLRGIDNALYYHLRPDDRSRYQNWTGTGNCLRLDEPRVIRLVMDSLRFWVAEMGVDGFRFDLAPVLGRTAAAGHAFDPRAPLLAAIAQDPLLSRCVLVAEPWDIGPGGYRLGAFPPGWLEWNDRFRDTQRGFWLRQGLDGAAGPGEFAQRFTGSSAEFGHDGRAPTASVNFVAVHDGFTLRDVVSYETRHNRANGEDNRDGSGDNRSRNAGVEGPSDDPAVQARRTGWQRVLLAALLLSQGTPMLLAGDEVGHTQGGNNNAYCQDNETSWIDWSGDGPVALIDFIARLTALRREAIPLRRDRWWPPADGAGPDGAAHIRWLDRDGAAMNGPGWQHATTLAIVFEPADGDGAATRWLVLVNAGAAPATFALPPGDWRLRLATDPAQDVPDTGAASAAPGTSIGPQAQVAASSLWLAAAAA